MRVSERSPHLLVLAPTRELAQQTAREAEWLVRYLDVSVVSLVGGLEMSPQLRALREGAAIVVGTPGRTRDHIERGSLRTEGICCVVLDEGDQMLDMGFREELEAILDALPEDRRTLALLGDDAPRGARAGGPLPRHPPDPDPDGGGGAARGYPPSGLHGPLKCSLLLTIRARRRHREEVTA